MSKLITASFTDNQLQAMKKAIRKQFDSTNNDKEVQHLIACAVKLKLHDLAQEMQTDSQTVKLPF